MSKFCRKCGKNIPNRVMVDGIVRSLQNRKYCLECSPWGKHNTKIIPYRDGFKTCCQCGKEKPLSEFYRKNKKRLQSLCKPCLCSYQMARWIERKKKAVQLLGGQCSRCGYKTNFASLIFHHKDSIDKEFDWNKLRMMAKETIEKELKKCILVCSNCHGEIHYPECML